MHLFIKLNIKMYKYYLFIKNKTLNKIIKNKTLNFLEKFYTFIFNLTYYCLISHKMNLCENINSKY